MIHIVAEGQLCSSSQNNFVVWGNPMRNYFKRVSALENLIYRDHQGMQMVIQRAHL